MAAIMLWSLYATWSLLVIVVAWVVLGRVLAKPRREIPSWADGLPEPTEDISVYRWAEQNRPPHNGTITTLMVHPHNDRYRPRRRTHRGTVYGRRPSPWEGFQMLPPPARGLPRLWWSLRIRAAARWHRPTRTWQETDRKASTDD